jgi:hypothetical protein
LREGVGELINEGKDHFACGNLQPKDRDIHPFARSGLRLFPTCAFGNSSTFLSHNDLNFSFRNAANALKFGQEGHFINPSRISPLVTNVRRMNVDGKNLRLFVGKSHAICVTAIASTESYLLSVPSVGLSQKQLRGIVHSQEWERFAAFFGMVFHQSEMGAQLYKDALSFTTKSGEIGRQCESYYSSRQLSKCLMRCSSEHV